ncbi:MAG: hypothetical protein NC211_09275 [Alistipes senegalensis]|nr:hypothetical protein [Oxalobacter formigenes]MCM1281999.1 hypothetical protein [Alistipes senegalensis]
MADAPAVEDGEAEGDIPVFSRGEQAGGEQTFYQQSLPGTYEQRGFTASAQPGAAEQAEANRQYDEIAAKYKGTALWMKAPNGEPTKLSERQWVQARTANFKAVFGDWEKAYQKQFLEGDVVTSVDGDRLRTTDGTKPSVKVLEYFASIGNKASNSIIGDVILDERAVRLGIAHKTSLNSYVVAKDVIEKGMIIDYDNNHKGNGSEGAVIAAPVKIGGRNFIGYVVARKSGNENRFYAAGITLRENLQQGAQKTSSSADEQAAVEISGYPTAEVRSRKSDIRILLNAIYAVNLSISNIVDKNGEPAASCWVER